jgi:hypothetical protein
MGLPTRFETRLFRTDSRAKTRRNSPPVFCQEEVEQGLYSVHFVPLSTTGLIMEMGLRGVNTPNKEKTPELERK